MVIILHTFSYDFQVVQSLKWATFLWCDIDSTARLYAPLSSPLLLSSLPLLYSLV